MGPTHPAETQVVGDHDQMLLLPLRFLLWLYRKHHQTVRSGLNRRPKAPWASRVIPKYKQSQTLPWLSSHFCPFHQSMLTGTLRLI